MMIKRILLFAILTILLFVPCYGDAKIVSVYADDIVLALDDSGTVWAWGKNDKGQLGIGTIGGNHPPDDARMVLIDNVTAIATDGLYSYALKRDGTVWAWGTDYRGTMGNIGPGTHPAPAQLSGLTDVVAIAPTNMCCYVLKSDGTVWAWGSDIEGKNGDITLIPDPVRDPVQVPGLRDIIALGNHGHYGAYAIGRDGAVFAWGNNTLHVNPATGNVTSGRLGDPARSGVCTAFQVPGVNDVKQIDMGMGGDYTLYLKNDGSVWGWGRNKGVLGNGVSHYYEFKEGYDIWDIANMTRGDSVWNYQDIVCTLPPVQAKISNVKQISPSHSYQTVAALKNDGTVWEWGTLVGATGMGGSSGEALSPTQVGGIGNVVHLCAGSAFIVAVKDDGSVWGWGHNTGNVLGETDTNRIFSVPIKLFTAPVSTPTPTPTPTPTQKPAGSPCSAPTLEPSITPTPSETPTSAPSGTIQPTTDGGFASPISGMFVTIAGLTGLLMVSGFIIYLWWTKKM